MRAPQSSARMQKDDLSSVVDSAALDPSQAPQAPPTSQDGPRRLHVNVQKLDSGTLSGLQAASAAIETAMAESDRSGLGTKASRRSKGKRREKGEEKKDEVSYWSACKCVIPLY